MAVFKFRDRRKNSSGAYDIYHPETEAGLVLFDDGDTFQQKFDAGELTGGPGVPGQRGTQWLTGTLLSGTSTTTGAHSSSSMPASLVGDMYLNTTYGYTYQCTTAGTGSAAKWTYKGSIMGATGAPGTTTWAGITDKPSTFAPSSHQHAASDITGTLPVSKGGTGKSSALTAADVGALPLTGGTLTGNLRIYSGDNETVHKLNLGDEEFVYISEPEDDYMEIHASHSIRFTGCDESSSNPLPASQGGTGCNDGSRLVYYATCDTAASTVAKVASLSGFALATGAQVVVKFTNANTSSAPTLNVNGTGAKYIKKYGTTAPDTYLWAPGAVVSFVYDGAYWVMADGTTATTTYYGKTKLSDSVSSTSTTLAATANAVRRAYELAQEASQSSGGLSVVTGAFTGTTSLNSVNLGGKPKLVIIYGRANNQDAVASSMNNGSYNSIPRILSAAYTDPGYGKITDTGFQAGFTFTDLTVYYVAFL